MRRLLLVTLGTALTALLLVAALPASPAAAAEGVGWQRSFDGHLHGGDAFTAVAATAGGVYAAGYTASSWANRSDILLVRYAANGSRSWVRTWNGPASGSDQCWALARFRRGGLCLAGSTAGHGGDAAILRYSSSGRLLWHRRFDTGSRWQDEARLVQPLAASDGICVVVESRSGASFRTSIARYSLSGRRVWVQRLATGIRVTGVVADAHDNLYLSGWAESASGSEAVLSSFTSDGSSRWTTRLPGEAAFSRATSIADLGDGIVWTMDSTAQSGTLGQGRVLASHYAPPTQLWEAGADTPFPYALNAVAGTKAGSVVAVGRLHGDQGDQGFALVTDASGAAQPLLLWSDAAGCGGDFVAPALDGSSWIAGRTGYAFSVLHLVPGSGLVWRYDYCDRAAGRVLALGPASDAGAYVVGWGRAMGSAADAVVMRVSP